MAQSLQLYSVDGGWRLRAPGIENDQVFPSGARAEAAALRLARAFAESGTDVVLTTLTDGAAWGHVRLRSLRAGRRALEPPDHGWRAARARARMRSGAEMRMA